MKMAVDIHEVCKTGSAGHGNSAKNGPRQKINRPGLEIKLLKRDRLNNSGSCTDLVAEQMLNFWKLPGRRASC